MVDPDIFNDVPIFALLDAEERLVLAQQVGVRNFDEGEIIFETGEPSGHAYLIQKGKVNVSITDIAHEVVVVDVVEVKLVGLRPRSRCCRRVGGRDCRGYGLRYRQPSNVGARFVGRH